MAARQVRPTPRGLVVLGAGLVALVTGSVAAYPGVTGLGLGLLALLAVSLGSVLVPSAVAATRTIEPARVTRLEACTTVLTLRNASVRTSRTVRGHDAVAGSRVLLPTVVLPPGRTHEQRTPVTTARRGRYAVGPLELDRVGLADLVRERSRHLGTGSVLVVPRLLDVPAPPPGARRGHVGADERVEHGGTDLVGIREYVAGDDLRRLHWATSARTGTLMVREDADPAEPRLTVLLDDRASAWAGDGFEEGVELAASLAAAALRAGAPVRWATAGGTVVADVGTRVGGAGGREAAVADLLDRAASLPTVPGDPTDDVPTGARPDVLAVVCGPGSDLVRAARSAGRAAHGTVLVVDPSPERVVGTLGTVVVLRGPRAEDLVAAWTSAVTA